MTEIDRLRQQYKTLASSKKKDLLSPIFNTKGRSFDVNLTSMPNSSYSGKQTQQIVSIDNAPHGSKDALGNTVRHFVTNVTNNQQVLDQISNDKTRVNNNNVMNNSDPENNNNNRSPKQSTFTQSFHENSQPIPVQLLQQQQRRDSTPFRDETPVTKSPMRAKITTEASNLNAQVVSQEGQTTPSLFHKPVPKLLNQPSAQEKSILMANESFGNLQSESRPGLNSIGKHQESLMAHQKKLETQKHFNNLKYTTTRELLYRKQNNLDLESDQLGYKNDPSQSNSNFNQGGPATSFKSPQGLAIESQGSKNGDGGIGLGAYYNEVVLQNQKVIKNPIFIGVAADGGPTPANAVILNNVLSSAASSARKAGEPATHIGQNSLSVPQSGLRHAQLLEKIIQGAENSHLLVQSREGVYAQSTILQGNTNNQLFHHHQSDQNYEDYQGRGSGGQKMNTNKLGKNRKTSVFASQGQMLHQQNSSLLGQRKTSLNPPVNKGKLYASGSISKDSQMLLLNTVRNRSLIDQHHPNSNMQQLPAAMQQQNPMNQQHNQQGYSKYYSNVKEQLMLSNRKQPGMQTKARFLGGLSQDYQTAEKLMNISVAKDLNIFHTRKENGSHMAQTLSSIRRQNKRSLKQNQERYNLEEQIKNQLKLIKAKITSNRSKALNINKIQHTLQKQQKLNNQLTTDRKNVPNRSESKISGGDSLLERDSLANKESPQKLISPQMSHLSVPTGLVDRKLSLPLQFGEIQSPLLPEQESSVGKFEIQTSRQNQSPFHMTQNQNIGHIHRLYKGNLKQEVEKEVSLTQFQLNRVKFTNEKQGSQIVQLRSENAKLKARIRQYTQLVSEKREEIKKKSLADQINPDDVNETSVTRKLAGTEFGDISDALEMGSVLNKSIERYHEVHMSMHFPGQAINTQGTSTPISGRISQITQKQTKMKINMVSASLNQMPLINATDKDNSQGENNTGGGGTGARITGEGSAETRKNKRRENSALSDISIPDAAAVNYQLRGVETREGHHNQQQQLNLHNGGLSVAQGGAGGPGSETMHTVSRQAYSRHAVVRGPQHSQHVNLSKFTYLMTKLEMAILPFDNKIEMIIRLISEFIKKGGLTKCSFYAIHHSLVSLYNKNVPTEKKHFIKEMKFKDNSLGGESLPIICIGNPSTNCKSIAFTSFVDPEAPQLLPSTQEDRIVVCLQDHRIGIMVRNTDLEPFFYMQFELNSVRTRKRPLRMSDVNLFKVFLQLFSERMMKFSILASNMQKGSRISEVVDFVMRISAFETQKTLCRSLQDELEKLEMCKNCILLIDEKSSRQLFTIAFAADDDYQAEGLSTIKEMTGVLERAIKNREQPHKIKAIEKQLEKVKSDLETDQAVRNMTLERNSMVCVPYDMGITGSVHGKNKIAYFNDFEKAKHVPFYPETDNFKQLKRIQNFLFMPLLGNNGKANGVIQCFSYTKPIDRLQVKRMAAMRKFLGGCLDKVEIYTKNLEMFVGFKMQLEEALVKLADREEISRQNMNDMAEMVTSVKIVEKDITVWHTRATTEPGFMPEPDDPQEIERKRKLQEAIQRMEAQTVADRKKEEDLDKEKQS